MEQKILQNLLAFNSKVKFRIFIESYDVMFYNDAKGTDFEKLWTGRCHVPKLLVNEEGAWQILLNSPNYGKTLKDHLITSYLVKLSERGLKEIKV